jgi:predicted molibdopterin-dependent oxidoreductase YjgC
MGEDVVSNVPNTKHVKNALSKLDFLVVQDIFMTETANLADVVIPSLAWAEKEGSYTNLERRMQMLGKAVDGKGMDDWQAIAEVSRMLGFDMYYKDSRDIISEIAKVSPLHKDISYEDMADGECMWPYKGEPLRHGMSIEGIEVSKFEIRKSEIGNRVYIGIDNPLFHADSLSRNSVALHSIAFEPYARMNKVLAQELSIADGDYVAITTNSGNIELSAQIDSDLPANIVLIPSNFDGKGVFAVMNWRMNQVIKSPAMDFTECVVRKASSVERRASSTRLSMHNA